MIRVFLEVEGLRISLGLSYSHLTYKIWGNETDFSVPYGNSPNTRILVTGEQQMNGSGNWDLFALCFWGLRKLLVNSPKNSSSFVSQTYKELFKALSAFSPHRGFLIVVP